MCLALLPPGATAKDQPPAFHVASIESRSGGKIDDEIYSYCDVRRIVTTAIQKKKLTRGTSTELAIRIDRVVRLRGQPPPRPASAGSELGLTLVAVGAKPMDQPFLCTKYSLLGTNVASHCPRLAKCSETIAKQMTTWLSRKPD
jgi:hypothetical protein